MWLFKVRSQPPDSKHAFLTFQLDLPPDAIFDRIKADTSTNCDSRGSFDYDQENGYTLKWDNLVKFKERLEHETASKTIELVRKEISRSSSNHWIEKHIYVCGRGFSGGKKKELQAENRMDANGS